jgi:hypothetical protein
MTLIRCTSELSTSDVLPPDVLPDVQPEARQN